MNAGPGFLSAEIRPTPTRELFFCGHDGVEWR